jgi:hypothetical protein
MNFKSIVITILGIATVGFSFVPNSVARPTSSLPIPSTPSKIDTARTIIIKGYVVPSFQEKNVSDPVYETLCRDVQITLSKDSKIIGSTYATPRNSSEGKVNGYECQYSLTFQGDISDYLTANSSGSPTYVITAARGGFIGLLGSENIFRPLPDPLSVTIKVHKHTFVR